MMLVLIALAGALGAIGRYGIVLAVGARPFPAATLGINLAGSFALGVFLEVAVTRRWPDVVVLPVATGLLGAFTTFSTFSVETQVLLRTERPLAALAYVGASVLGGLLMAFLGFYVARFAI
jgi:fluoride exporter